VRRWIDGEFDKLTVIAGTDVQREVRRGIPEQEILKSVPLRAGRYRHGLHRDRETSGAGLVS